MQLVFNLLFNLVVGRLQTAYQAVFAAGALAAAVFKARVFGAAIL
jgi:hypothetical protein